MLNPARTPPARGIDRYVGNGVVGGDPAWFTGNGDTAGVLILAMGGGGNAPWFAASGNTAVLFGGRTWKWRWR